MTQLTPEQDVFLDRLAEIVRRYGLRDPALMVLEAGRPLAFLGGQLLWLLQPALSLLVPGKQVAALAQVLEKPETVSALVARLETSDA
ncbi:MAG: hypothetical protein H6667_14655 [Ardenticatenaceae bacterium]|nr:hypothetical protein [Ardenticatenaceae bacterium]MCB9445518.1 hypothetical protein [Ardenticatenaceae bacterium]